MDYGDSISEDGLPNISNTAMLPLTAPRLQLHALFSFPEPSHVSDHSSII